MHNLEQAQMFVGQDKLEIRASTKLPGVEIRTKDKKKHSADCTCSACMAMKADAVHGPTHAGCQACSMKYGMSAGGPGSGRKPEFNSQKQKDAHKMVSKAGFKFVKTRQFSNDLKDRFNVYKKPGHSELHVHSDGYWNHGIQGDGSFSKLGKHLKGLDN